MPQLNRASRARALALAAALSGLAAHQAGAEPFYRVVRPFQAPQETVTPPPPASSNGAGSTPSPQSALAVQAPQALVQQTADGTACASVPVTNTSSNDAVGLTGALSRGSDFALCQPPGTPCQSLLQAGATCALGVRLASGTPGNKSDTLVVTANAPTASANLTGSYFNPTGLSFPAQGYTYRYGKQATIAPTVTGGIGARSFAIAGPVPAGMAIDPASGLISVTAPGSAVPTSSVTARLTDLNGTVSASFDYAVLPPMTLSYQSNVLASGRSVTVTPSAAYAGSATTYSVEGDNPLPAHGLSLDPSTGAISGTPPALDVTRSVTLHASDPDGTSVSTRWLFSAQPIMPSILKTAGVTTYGNPADDVRAFALGLDGAGFTIPPGESVSTAAYPYVYAGTAVSLGTGPDAGGNLKVEYLATSNAWVATGQTGDTFLGPGSVAMSPMAASVVAFKGLRVTNVGTSPAQLDYVNVLRQ